MAVCRPCINNFKISLKLQEYTGISRKIRDLEQSDDACRSALGLDLGKKESSFFVLRDLDGCTKAVYNIFYKGHVNISRLTSLSQARQACDVLCGRLKVPQTGFRVDNITATGKLNIAGSVSKLKQICDYLAKFKRDCDIKSINFDTQKFPGAFAKPSTHIKGTALIFNSGRLVLVGCKSKSDVTDLHNWLEVAIWRATTSACTTAAED